MTYDPTSNPMPGAPPAPAAPAASGGTRHPVQLTVERSAKQSRALALFIYPIVRVVMLIPVIVVLYVLMFAAEIVTIVGLTATLFTGSYPAGMHKFVTGVLQLEARTYAFLYGLTDSYPGFSITPGDGVHPVQLTIERSEKQSRVLALLIVPIVRMILLIPVIIVLYILGLAAGLLGIVGLIAILFTGSYPAGMHKFVTGVLRLMMRTGAYALGLTDTYPGINMEP